MEQELLEMIKCMDADTARLADVRRKLVPRHDPIDIAIIESINVLRDSHRKLAKMMMSMYAEWGRSSKGDGE